MKVDMDYKIIYRIMGKLSRNEALDAAESAAALTVIKAGEDDIFPSQEELEHQSRRVASLDNLDADSDRFKRLLDECTEFENKYC